MIVSPIIGSDTRLVYRQAGFSISTSTPGHCMDGDHIDDDDDCRFKPSRKEIAEGCREIQAGWTPEERIQRRRVKPRKVADTENVVAVAREACDFTLARRRAKRAG